MPVMIFYAHVTFAFSFILRRAAAFAEGRYIRSWYMLVQNRPVPAGACGW